MHEASSFPCVSAATTPARRVQNTTSMPEQPPGTTHLLVVDDEEELLWTLSQRLAGEPFTVLTACDGVAALDVLSRSRVDVLVADIRMPRMGGLELVMNARRARADLPVVVMTAYPTGDLRTELADRGSIEYLEKPFDFVSFLDAVERAKARNARGFTGAISVQTLPDVVQLYALSNATGALRVSCKGQNGAIWFERGAVPHAETEGGAGAEAFLRILSWTGGAFTMTTGEPPPARTITMGWMELILESCRRSDERAGERDRASTKGEPNFELFAPHETCRPTNEEKTEVMPNYKESISKLEGIDGFIGACLCDGESGMPMAIVGGNAALNLEVASATNAEVLRAKAPSENNGTFWPVRDGHFCGGKRYSVVLNSWTPPKAPPENNGTFQATREAIFCGSKRYSVVHNSRAAPKRKAAKALNLKDDIEEILITLGKQYHLIRPLKAKPMVFFYLALDRAHSNLAMARMTLADVEREVVV